MITKRLQLRSYKEEDLKDFYEYISDPEVVKYEPCKPLSLNEAKEDLAGRIKNPEFIAVELADTHRLIGNIYFGKREFNSFEIGYVFNRKYWKCGYAKEACLCIIEDAFAKGVHRIYAECDAENPSSFKLLENMGFIREGYLKQNVYFWKDENGQPLWKDTCIYSKLNDE